MNTFKKYPKDWLIVLGVVLMGFFGVMGTHFSDIAKTPFWWNFWIILSVVCIVAWVGGWIFLNRKDKGK